MQEITTSEGHFHYWYCSNWHCCYIIYMTSLISLIHVPIVVRLVFWGCIRSPRNAVGCEVTSQMSIRINSSGHRNCINPCKFMRFNGLISQGRRDSRAKISANLVNRVNQKLVSIICEEEKPKNMLSCSICCSWLSGCKGNEKSFVDLSSFGRVDFEHIL